MHCPKCMIRSKLWSAETQLGEGEIPKFALMARDMAGYQQVPAEIVERMDAEANTKLY